MADKKITALTALTATGKDSAADLLHIIDFSASPVNKKISVANLFSNANTDTHIYGASKTLEVGFAAATNAHLSVTTGANATTDGAVTINDDGVDYVDFLVKSGDSDAAIKVDAGATPNNVTINGDSANLDFIVNGDAVAKMLFVDASSDVVGVGVTAPDTAYSLDVAATGVKGIKSAGTVDVTGDITCTANASVTGDLTVTSRLFLNDAIATALVGGIDVANDIDIPLTDLVTHLLPTNASTDFYALPAGTAGQVKILINTHATLPIKVTAAMVHVGSTLDLQAGESATLIATTGGWMMLNYGGAVTT